MAEADLGALLVTYLSCMRIMERRQINPVPLKFRVFKRKTICKIRVIVKKKSIPWMSLVCTFEMQYSIVNDCKFCQCVYKQAAASLRDSEF